jgi:hypothetical protein
LQAHLGLSWAVGCFLFGAIIVNNSMDCRISKQYLCQVTQLRAKYDPVFTVINCTLGKWRIEERSGIHPPFKIKF